MGTILSKARLQVKCSLWGRVLLEKVTVPLVVKKFPAYYGTQRFMTAFKGNPPAVPLLSQSDLVSALTPFLEDPS
jgi:hypothetical protein